jgi:hypothetical protein
VDSVTYLVCSPEYSLRTPSMKERIMWLYTQLRCQRPRWHRPWRAPCPPVRCEAEEGGGGIVEGERLRGVSARPRPPGPPCRPHP